MSKKKSTDNEGLELEDMMAQKIRDNFANPESSQIDFSDERLDAMNKKLPSWNLEPPYSYLNKK